jgi:hypothetical protein
MEGEGSFHYPRSPAGNQNNSGERAEYSKVRREEHASNAIDRNGRSQ